MAHVLLVFCPSLFLHFVADEIVYSNCWTNTFFGLRYGSIGVIGSSCGYISIGISVKNQLYWILQFKIFFLWKGMSMSCTISSSGAGGGLTTTEKDTQRNLKKKTQKQALHYFLDTLTPTLQNSDLSQQLFYRAPPRPKAVSIRFFFGEFCDHLYIYTVDNTKIKLNTAFYAPTQHLHPLLPSNSHCSPLTLWLLSAPPSTRLFFPQTLCAHTFHVCQSDSKIFRSTQYLIFLSRINSTPHFILSNSIYPVYFAHTR